MSTSEPDANEAINPPQKQDKQPGIEAQMIPQPQYMDDNYRGSGKLADKVAIITGGDSGIGRAIAIHFAVEGANVVINYLSDHEQEDVDKTLNLIQEQGAQGLAIQGDVSDESFCNSLLDQTIKQYGRIDIVVNNAAVQYPQESIVDINQRQLEKTFKVNVFSEPVNNSV